MPPASPKGKRCRYCGHRNGEHLYDCPVLRDNGTNAPGSGNWWK
jgi:lipopolysaccharide biosynthesis regulator YciM